MDAEKRFEEEKALDMQQINSGGANAPNNVIGMRSGDEDLVDDSPGLTGTQELQIGKFDSD